MDKTPAAQVFRAGEPVDRDSEAFVERKEVVDELASQILLSAGSPGLVLYGRRRMGKSTVLKLLHLDPTQLVAVQEEGTQVLPGF